MITIFKVGEEEAVRRLDGWSADTVAGLLDILRVHVGMLPEGEYHVVSQKSGEVWRCFRATLKSTVGVVLVAGDPREEGRSSVNFGVGVYDEVGIAHTRFHVCTSDGPSEVMAYSSRQAAMFAAQWLGQPGDHIWVQAVGDGRGSLYGAVSYADWEVRL